MFSKHRRLATVHQCSVSQPPGRGPVPGPGINYTGPREILLELINNLNVILYLSTCHTVHIIVLIFFMIMPSLIFNSLKPNDHYSGRIAPLNSKVAFYIFIQQIQVLNILNMVYTLRFSLQNAVCFIILTYLVPVLFTFYNRSC